MGEKSTRNGYATAKYDAIIYKIIFQNMFLLKKFLINLKNFFWWIKKFFLIKNSEKNFSKIFNNILKKEEVNEIKIFLMSDNFKAVEISATHIINKLKLNSIESLANNEEEKAKKEILMSKWIEFYLWEIRRLKGCK